MFLTRIPNNRNASIFLLILLVAIGLFIVKTKYATISPDSPKRIAELDAAVDYACVKNLCYGSEDRDFWRQRLDKDNPHIIPYKVEGTSPFEMAILHYIVDGQDGILSIASDDGRRWGPEGLPNSVE